MLREDILCGMHAFPAPCLSPAVRTPRTILRFAPPPPPVRPSLFCTSWRRGAGTAHSTGVRAEVDVQRSRAGAAAPAEEGGGETRKTSVDVQQEQGVWAGRQEDKRRHVVDAPVVVAIVVVLVTLQTMI